MFSLEFAHADFQQLFGRQGDHLAVFDQLHVLLAAKRVVIVGFGKLLFLEVSHIVAQLLDGLRIGGVEFGHQLFVFDFLERGYQVMA